MKVVEHLKSRGAQLLVLMSHKLQTKSNSSNLISKHVNTCETHLQSVLVVIPGIVQEEHAFFLVLLLQPALHTVHKPTWELRHLALTSGDRLQLGVIECLDLWNVW